jgi:transglutaminase/protease-like cytokinesis protein 3
MRKIFSVRKLIPLPKQVNFAYWGREIKHRFPDDATRLKASYLWVIKNLTYDCEGLKNKNSRWALDTVLRYRKAVCAGYVNVFRNLCDAAGVECVDVNGYGRSGFESLLVNIDSFASNHTGTQ